MAATFGNTQVRAAAEHPGSAVYTCQERQRQRRPADQLDSRTLGRSNPPLGLGSEPRSQALCDEGVQPPPWLLCRLCRFVAPADRCVLFSCTAVLSLRRSSASTWTTATSCFTSASHELLRAQHNWGSCVAGSAGGSLDVCGFAAQLWRSSCLCGAGPSVHSQCLG